MKNRDLLFKRITERIAARDFSGYTIQYPPLFAAGHEVGDKEALGAWRALAGRKPEFFGLYVHLPYCKQKCTYCRYCSEELLAPADQEAYLAALYKEARLYGAQCGKAAVNSLYIGGGTPALLSEKQLAELFAVLRANFDLARCRQVAFEGNPDFLTTAKLTLLKRLGVNRLTIGVQTLDQKVIRAVNRYQSKGSFFKCIRAARKAGIENINVDLMAGLPSQTIRSVAETLNAVIRSAPDMIHVHPFYPTPLCEFTGSGRQLSRKEMRRRETMAAVSGELIARAGYGPVKFDAHGKSESARNLQLSDSVEHDAPFLGLGAGAVSHATGSLKYVNHNEPAQYVRLLRAGRLPLLSARRTTKMDEMIYFVTASLRYGAADGREFRKLFGRGISGVFGPELRYLARRGKLKMAGGRVVSLMRSIGEYQVYTKYFYRREIVAFYEKELGWKDRAADPVKFDDELRYMCL